jgi:hypothetical protein
MQFLSPRGKLHQPVMIVDRGRVVGHMVENSPLAK